MVHLTPPAARDASYIDWAHTLPGKQVCCFQSCGHGIYMMFQGTLVANHLSSWLWHSFLYYELVDVSSSYASVLCSTFHKSWCQKICHKIVSLHQRQRHEMPMDNAHIVHRIQCASQIPRGVLPLCRCLWASLMEP